MKIKAWTAAAVMAAVLLTGPDRLGVARAQEDPAAGATTPAELSEPPEKQPIVAAGKTIKINFPEMDLESILKNFSAITGKSFILDQMPKGQIVTVGPIGPVEIPREQAMRLFTLIMDINGFVIVSTSVDNVYKVVRKSEAIKEGTLELYPPGKVPERSENLVTRFIQLRYLDSAEIVAQLTALTTKDGGQVIAYPPLNMLIIIDTAINIERMLEVIRILDVPTPEPSMEIVVLKYSTPEEMSTILGQIFEVGGGGATSRSATTTPTARRRRTPPGEPTPPQPQSPVPAAPGGGDSGPTLKIIPVERINGLIIIADRGLMMAVKEMIVKLDVDAGMGGSIHVYYVQNAEAGELASTLAGLSGKGGGTSASTTSRRDSQSDQTYPRAPGVPGVPGMPETTGPTRNRTSAPSTSSATLSIPGLLSGDVSITADEPTNSLIIFASPQDWAVLQDVISKLDIPRRQVFVEAVLLELTYEESKSGGVSVHGASPLENDGVLLAGTNFGAPNSLGILGSIASGGGSLALPSGLTLGALGRAVTIPGTNVQIPSAGIIVKLLATYSDVNVLSTPTLLTIDNEEASIEVGEKIPMPSGSSVSTGGYANYSITREAVGIKLNITPQINESDNIKMEIYTEISSAAPSAQGLDVNQYGVTTTNKVAETSVIVRDAQTIVIGGLMKDTDMESSSWVPFLGDIPVLGWLFKNASKNKTKTNLIILITPHIVKSDNDFHKVNAHVREGYTEMQYDSRGKDSDIDWYKYFETQYPEPAPAPAPAPAPEQAPPPESRSLEWDWAPESGATAETTRSRSAQTGDDGPGAGTTP